MATKSKDKKAQRKAGQALAQARQNTIKTALYTPEGGVRDVLADFAPFCGYDRNGVAAQLSFCTPSTMPDDVRAFVFDLTKANMEDTYVRSGWGWSDAKKRRELFDNDARFLVFRRRVADDAPEPKPAGELLAFAHFKFSVEGERECIYVWEIQVASGAQRLGLGKRMMQVMELIGHKWGMKVIMLTVLKLNPGAVSFYTNTLKYAMDETSPTDDVDDDVPYIILSKSLERGAKAAAPAAAAAAAPPSSSTGASK